MNLILKEVWEGTHTICFHLYIILENKFSTQISSCQRRVWEEGGIRKEQEEILEGVENVHHPILEVMISHIKTNQIAHF